MRMDHGELMLLSRTGRVPRAVRAGPGAIDAREPRTRLTERLRGRREAGTERARRGELNTHAYLDLEFVVDDERH
jgi:hypothetical protein